LGASRRRASRRWQAWASGARPAQLQSGGGEYSPGEENLSPWRKIILLIPMIFLLPHLWPDAVAGVYLEEPIAGTVAVCTAAPMFYAYYRGLKS